MSTSLTHEQFVELCRLIQLLHNEQITPEERARLEAWICHDKEAGCIYVQYMNLCARLHWDRRRDSEPDHAESNSKPGTSPSPVLGFLGNVFQAGSRFLSRPFVLTLLLTIGLPGVVLLLLVVNMARQPLPPASQPSVAVASVAVAEITKMHRAVWGEASTELPPGTKLIVGQQLQLKEGLAEITFTDGVQVVIEAPLTLKILGRNAGFLPRGRLVASVPPKARGFTIETPLATIVDLGTDFGVDVGVDGATEAHVFQGRIRVGERDTEQEATQSFRELRVGQAARIRQVGVERKVQTETMAALPRQFIRRIPPENSEGLPEPKILFAHRGDRDPTTEGWTIMVPPGATEEDYAMVPVKDQDAAAWMIQDRSTKKDMNIFRYYIRSDVLSQEIADKGRKQGWVMRARINLVGQEPFGRKFVDHFAYCDGFRAWRIRLSLNPDGSQSLVVADNSSLGKDARTAIPNSRGRYVDYELRYKPATDDVDVYVDGRLTATACSGNSDEVQPQEGKPGRSLLRFGTGAGSDQTSEMRVALVEWGILGEASGPLPTVHPQKGE